MSDLDGIKAGDLVCTRNHCGWNSIGYSAPTAVERVTKTQVIACANRWNIRTGRSVGARDWSTETLIRYTPEIAEEIRHQKAVRVAVIACENAARKLAMAAGQDAIDLAAILPPQLKETSE